MDQVEPVKAILENGAVIRIEARQLGGPQRIANPNFTAPFTEVTQAIEGIASSFVETLKKVQPRGAIVEFGLEIGVESGNLTALLVKGTGTANLKITLQWGEMS
jgi:Trypsin-co-occurring domain 1